MRRADKLKLTAAFCLAALCIVCWLFPQLPAHAAQTVLMWGQTTAGAFVPIQVDANGVLQTNASNIGSDVTLTDRSQTALPNSATLIAALNLSRKSIELQNNGTTGVWISFTTVTPTVNGSGCFELYPSGGSYHFPAGVVYTSAVYGISTSGTNDLTAVEGQ